MGEARPLHGETEGASRFGVTARLAVREFRAFRLDVDFATDQPFIEMVPVHLPLLEFVGLADLAVPMISIAQQLAEKLHAVMRTYSSRDSSRAKDAYDTILLAQIVGLPAAAVLREAVERTFAIRDTPVPAAPADLPDEWTEPLGALLSGFALPGIRGLDELKAAWSELWQPILDSTCSEASAWDPAKLSWA